MTRSASIRRRDPSTRTQAQLAAVLTAHDVREAARQLPEPRQYPPGFRESTTHDVWIDIGTGPKRYPPKVIVVLPAARHGFEPGPGFKGAGDGVWVSRLKELGFPVLAKAEEPDLGPDCRGADVAATPKQPTSAAGVGSGNAVALRPSMLLHDDVVQAIRELDAGGNTRRVGDDLHQTAYRIPVNGRWYSMLSVLQIALRRHGVTTPGPLKALLRANAGFTKRRVWRDRLRELGFPPQRGHDAPSAAVQSGPTDAAPWPSPEALTHAGIIAAARAWPAQTHEFRTAHAAREWEVWIEDKPYPVKAICLMAYLSLGYDAKRIGSWTKGGRNSAWDRKIGALGFPIQAMVDPGELDLERFLEREDVPTEIRREVIARLTQGSFRRDLIAARRGVEQCDVTGIAIPQVLRAGHIHRWADCKDTPAMRRDPANGLVLAAHLDALFEHGLITFADDGRMLISPRLDAAERAQLQISEPRGLSFKPTPRQCEYLATHRERCASLGTEPA